MLTPSHSNGGAAVLAPVPIRSFCEETLATCSFCRFEYVVTTLSEEQAQLLSNDSNRGTRGTRAWVTYLPDVLQRQYKSPLALALIATLCRQISVPQPCVAHHIAGNFVLDHGESRCRGCAISGNSCRFASAHCRWSGLQRRTS